jgi:hypothetical protein
MPERKRVQTLTNKKTKSAILLVGAAALIFTLPAIGQQGPESLLPPGFGDPPPTPPPATTRPSTPDPASPGNPATPRPSSSNAAPSDDDDKKDDDKDDEDEDEETEGVIRYDVPPAARRSLKAIGIISPASGGFPADAYGSINGTFLKNALRQTKGPLASRWATIMGRRLLVSRTDTPSNINGADWTAERAWLLLRMGDAVASRQLVQEVDADRYSKRLYQVAMQTFLANGDLGGMCPLAENGARIAADPTWKMARPICASLAGEQGTATALLNQARSQRWTTGIDYLLAEKAVGAGTNGRRSVKIEWDKVDGINSWRFGLAAATGLEPPARIYANAGRHMDGWRALLPMTSVAARTKAAPGAAALGVLSNRDMVDLYSQILDDTDAVAADQARAEFLATAYSGADESARMTAMTSLWDGAKAGADYHAMLVLTARAAALVMPSSTQSGSADRIIASMMTAGLDTPAAAWTNIVDEGSLGWALLAVGAPKRSAAVQYGPLDSFYDNDSSSDAHKSKLLLAGLAGLGRLDAEAQADFGGDLEVNIVRQTQWTRAISAAADRGESGTVALLALSGLQASDWTKVPPHHLYYITRALRQVGLEAEARMIAAEAVTFG